MAIVYQWENFDIPEAEGTLLDGINNRGEIAGDADGIGFLVNENGETEFFEPPESLGTLVRDINDRGVVVGAFFRGDLFTALPFIYDGSEVIVLDLLPESPDLEFTSINNSGQIVGYYFDEDFTGAEGFAIEVENLAQIGREDIMPIEIPGSDRTFFWGLNDGGKIVGQLRDEEGSNEGFLLDGDEIFPLEFPGSNFSSARGINNNDRVVGVFFRPETERQNRGFVWEDGQFLEIAFPGGSGTFPQKINDAGVVVGFYADVENVNHGFIATETADIAVFDGAINLIDGTTTTGIDLGRTQVGDEAIATLTVENQGDDDLMLTELKLPEGFSAVGEFIEDFILAPGDTTALEIQLDAEAGGNFSGTLQLFAADSSDEQFLVTSAISGTARETVRLLGTMGDDRGDEAIVLPPSPNDYIAFGGEGNDEISAVAANSIEADRLIGGPGNDELIAGTNDRLNGGSGGDRLDARNGGGGNSLLGGDGNDLLLSGVGDRLLGQAGNDILFAFGNSTLTGGAGADQFWLTADALRNGAPTITDFQLGIDSIGLGGLRIDGAIVSLSDLSFTDTSSGVSVSILALSEDPLAIVRGVTTDLLNSSSNFLFV